MATYHGPFRKHKHGLLEFFDYVGRDLGRKSQETTKIRQISCDVKFGPIDQKWVHSGILTLVEEIDNPLQLHSFRRTSGDIDAFRGLT